LEGRDKDTVWAEGVDTSRVRAVDVCSLPRVAVRVRDIFPGEVGDKGRVSRVCGRIDRGVRVDDMAKRVEGVARVRVEGKGRVGGGQA